MSKLLLPTSDRPSFRGVAATAARSLAAVLALSPALPAAGLVYRDDVTGAESGNLAQQKQFDGVGGVLVSGGIGTGVAISRDWILTASHFTSDGQAVTFDLNGTRYAGTAINRPGTDVALIRLNAGVRLPADTVLIAPIEDEQVLDQLIWKVGIGRHGTATQAKGGPNALAGAGGLRAGTNVFDSAQTNFFGPSLVFNRSGAASQTAFEVTTAPGDSGGPAFLQRDNQWFIAGLTSGAIGGVGFIDANVAREIDFIKDTTGLTFSSKAAPTELLWDPDFDAAGVQTGGGSWDTERPNWTADDFQYTWESDFAPTAVFGTSATGAGLVTVNGQITATGIRFAPTVATSGPFQLLDGSGAINVGARGLAIDSQTFARFNAEVTGGGDVTKVGGAALTLDGDNASFSGEIFINEGTLTLTRAESLGVGGFNAGTRTTVADGATLELRGDGISSGELIRLTGAGVGGGGALSVTRGDHELTESVALLGAARVNTDGGTSLTMAGARGRFFNAQPLTKGGAGTLVLESVNNIAGLTAEAGTLAGTGGVNGTVVIANGATLAVGDDANGPGLGSFRTNDLNLGLGSELLVDLDAAGGAGDLVDVRGIATLAGALRLSLLSAPVLGVEYLILENDGADPLRGAFASGGFISSGFGGETYNFAINYLAGSGNDVALSLVAVPEPGTAAVLAAAGLALLNRRRRA